VSLFRRSPVEARSDGGWYNLLGSGNGMDRSMKSALRLVSVYAATSLIADSIAIMPLSEYETVNGSKRKAARQSPLLLDPHPVPTMTRVEWLHQFTTSFLMRGNAYGLITELEPNGTPSKIAWLNPDSVMVDESGTLPAYSYKGKPLDPNTLLHIPWYPPPGSVVGLSPIGQFRQVIETGYLAEKFGKDWFDHGSTPSGHLKNTTQKLDPAEASKVKGRFKAAVHNNDIFVSGNDWEWEAL
jgi:HK97 family phage portal protein